MFAKLISWSQAEFSHLPWRKKRSLYRTLVSEVMLQQTTVSTVVTRFEPFVRQFPNLASLARATEDELVKAWKGLGYYRRAKNLRTIASSFLQEHNGRIPQGYDQLISTPGIGPYSAAALLAIGQNRRALPLDANLERVLARFYAVPSPKGEGLKKELQKRFARKEILKEMSKWGSRALSEALMDMGRTICRANKVLCQECPLQENCQARALGEPLRFPSPNPKTSARKLYHLSLLRVLVHDKRTLLGRVRNAREWLSGQIEPPTFVLASEDERFSQYPPLPKTFRFSPKESLSFKTGITKYRITNHVLLRSLKEFPLQGDYKLYPATEETNFSTATLKALRLTGCGFSENL